MNGNATDVIVVNDLRKVYDEQVAVADITFTVRQGEVFGLLGPNGSGKTTTLETIVGLRRPTSGTVTVLGFDPMRHRHRITERVAVQPQSATLFPTLTVWETVQLFASFYPASREPSELLEEVGLDDARKVRVKHLSGGQERRLLIGIALVGNPEVLVLAILVRGEIAAEGEPDALIREHTAKATVSFTIRSSQMPSDIRQLGITGEITSSETSQGTRISVVTDDPDAVLRRLTFVPGVHAFDYNIKHGSLEDVFVDISSNTTKP